MGEGGICLLSGDVVGDVKERGIRREFESNERLDHRDLDPSRGRVWLGCRDAVGGRWSLRVRDWGLGVTGLGLG